MSLRDSFPKPRNYASHYSVVLARGERARTYQSPPRACLLGVLSIVPILLLGCSRSDILFVFRDDLLASLMARQARDAIRV